MPKYDVDLQGQTFKDIEAASPEAAAREAYLRLSKSQGPSVREVPKHGLGQYALGLAESVPQTAMGLGREVVQFGRDIASVPSRLAQVGQIDLADVARHPGQLVTAGVETGRQLAAPLVQAIPEISGATIGTLLGGPGGAPLGAATMRELVGVLEGTPARERGQAAGTAALSTLVGQRAGQIPELVSKAPGRYLSLPAERHAAGAAMMEKIPERFGVDDAMVQRRYAAAKHLSKTSKGSSLLENFRGEAKRLAADLESNPIEALQDKSLAKQFKEISTQADELSSRGGATAGGVDQIIKAVNKKIGDATSTELGMWKDTLRSLHEDMRAASQTTGDPAFAAYAKAIETARLNFLRNDIKKVIETSGIRAQRTGQAVVTSPGAIQQWMRKNPEWVKAVEKANPGILDSIRLDLQEIIPITDIAGRAIPGAQAGSRRVVMGGAAGALAAKILGLSLYDVMAIGSLIGGFMPGQGFTMRPGYIRRSFQPITTPPSRVGLGAGAVIAPALGTENLE